MAKTTSPVRRITYSALLIAVGLLLPNLFHLVGGQNAGTVFLPMHIPILMAGLLLGPIEGVVVGVMAPLLSFIISGMPAAAVLPFMIVELIGYGFVSGLLTKLRCPVVVSLIGAQAAGRLLKALALFVTGRLLHLSVPGAATVFAALVTGLPGIALQWLLIPAAVYTIRKAGNFHV